MNDKNAFLDKNVKGLMMDILARWNREMDAIQAETPFAKIRPADLRLFGQMRGRPTPMTDLHKILGITRQAAHNSILRLGDHGVVEITESPESKKNKIVVVTERGQQLRELAAKSIGNIEKECADRIGKDGLDTLRQLLISLSN